MATKDHVRGGQDADGTRLRGPSVSLRLRGGKTVPDPPAAAGEPGSFEVGCCLGGDFRVDVDGADVPDWSGEGSEQRGVPPGPGSGFEDAVPVMDVELLEHGGDEVGHGGARQRGPCGAALGDHGEGAR